MDDFTHNLLTEYISRNYPIVRIKDKRGHRFKRAIVMDGGNVYYLSKTLDHQRFLQNLFITLRKVFKFSDQEINGAIEDQFNLKR